MPMNQLLGIWLRGELPQSKLDRLREDLSLTRRGRLTDSEDAEFGYRYLRDDYEGEPPSRETVDRIRRAILKAASQHGLEVDRVWPSDGL
jgi:hypothetical protein